MARAKKIPQFLTKEEFNFLIKSYLNNSERALSNRDKYARLRNVVIFSICFYMGFRPKEAKDIKISHIDLEKKEIYIPAENNKQRNQDVYPIPEIIFPLIKIYLRFRNSKSEWVFPSGRNQNKPIYRGTLIRAFEKAIIYSDFKKISYTDKRGNKRRNLSIYSLRHSFGTKAMNKLKDVKQVAKVMRHYDEKCRSTYVYIHTDNMASRKEMLDKVWE